MEKYYSKIGFYLAPNVKIRFGQEESIQDLWKQIIEIDDVKARHERIDKLLKLMEQNKEKNGFLGKTDKVDCGDSRGFLLDDKYLYYLFFDNLKTLNNQNKDGKFSDGAVINSAIKATITSYAGGDKVNRELRLELTSPTIIDDKLIVPSIKKQKGKNCFYCSERASIAHNFWLLTGTSSYFCWTDTDNFVGDKQSKNDAHHFTIVKHDGKFKLYDLALNNFCLLEDDVIDKLLSGQGLIVGPGKTVANPGVYAQNLESKLEKN